MTDPIHALYSIHNIRHNFVMLTICKNPLVTDAHELKTLISTEMMLFCAGCEHLTADDYATYVEWFSANTPMSILQMMKPLFPDSLQESVKDENTDAADIPF